jgi:hypothetical protein
MNRQSQRQGNETAAGRVDVKQVKVFIHHAAWRQEDVVVWGIAGDMGATLEGHLPLDSICLGRPPVTELLV